MTVTEAAIKLGVTYDFVLRLLRQGTLKGVKAGRVWKVDATAVSRRIVKNGG
jgi:excisionase family DNA binding protein